MNDDSQKGTNQTQSVEKNHIQIDSVSTGKYINQEQKQTNTFTLFWLS
jgi:hypothetical protein